jgi:glutamyl-tRNA reductase
VTSGLELVAVGIDHTTAGIELRERVAFAAADVPAALAQLTGPGGAPLEHAAILSTCCRVELYGATRSRPRPAELGSFLARYHGLDPAELDGALYVLRGDEVAHHLAATAAGMHSPVLGEAQIQGQVRAALDQAVAAGSAGTELRRMFEAAIAAGRRVRSDTRLGRGIASVPHASVEFARRRLGTLDGATVLLIGAGTMAGLTAKHLARYRLGELLVLGRAATREQLADALTRADVVISATSARGAVVRADDLAARDRAASPLLLIDLAVPRDIDPAVARLPDVDVYTLDDLRPVVEQALVQRHAELPAARSALRDEVVRFTSWLRRREAVTA